MGSIFERDRQEKACRRAREIQVRQKLQRRQRIIRDRILNGITQQREGNIYRAKEYINGAIRYLEYATMEGQGREIQEIRGREIEEIRRIAIEEGRIEGRIEGAVEAIQRMLESLVYNRDI